MQAISQFPPPRSRARYSLDVCHGLRVEEYDGRTGVGDFRGVALRASEDVDWRPEFSSLIDFQHAVLDLSANDVLRVALTWRQTRSRCGGWTAFVAGPGAGAGLIRMLGAWARITDRMEIFTDRGAAERWLARRTASGGPCHFGKAG